MSNHSTIILGKNRKKIRLKCSPKTSSSSLSLINYNQTTAFGHGIRRNLSDFVTSSKIKKLNYEYKWHSAIRGERASKWPMKKEQRRMKRKATKIYATKREERNVRESEMVEIKSLIVSNWCWNAVSLCVTLHRRWVIRLEEISLFYSFEPYVLTGAYIYIPHALPANHFV